MRYAVLGTAICLFIVTVITMFAVIFSTKANIRNVQNDVSISENDQKSESLQTYYLKEHDGKLAIFIDNQTTPAEIFNVYINTLPPFDQGQLKQGVVAKGYDELSALIEDYIS